MGKKPIVVMLHIKKEQRRLQKHLMSEGLPHGPSAMYAAMGSRYPMHSIPGPVGTMDGPSSRHGPVGPMVGPLREQMYLQQQSLLGLGGDRLDARGQGLPLNRSGQGLGAMMGHGGNNNNGGYNNHNHLATENMNRGGGYGRGNGGGGGMNNDIHHNGHNGGAYRMGAGGGGGVHGMGGAHPMGERGGTPPSSSLYGTNNTNKARYTITTHQNEISLIRAPLIRAP